MKEINGKSFIELETNDSLIPAIGKSLYNKMPIERPYNTAIPSKKFEDDEFYKEFLSQLEANTNESFDIVSINKKLKKRNKDKKKKERDPKKKEDKKGKAKEEKKPAKPKSGKATDKTGDSTKAPPKAKRRNRNQDQREKLQTTNRSRNSLLMPKSLLMHQPSNHLNRRINRTILPRGNKIQRPNRNRIRNKNQNWLKIPNKNLTRTHLLITPIFRKIQRSK